ncbi:MULTISPECIES: DUF3159 domain-containing protein [unclassified Nocardioides]|uniref:DUF3159 domain-containing protein n=1 Tax=unclassified Nocardioides TaxID=2615069 RepID=UPI0009F0432D|nr:MULTISPECIES: DUF3159 domain-containing protein [unclassified Nocardioides]GAW52193.1 uncharacterized protein PD653B2_4543 [Nocardioides sp. PD653-B2]GAW57502.1 uncharacterized protein PD653_4947 [Nocardioides sp. PD653]
MTDQPVPDTRPGGTSIASVEAVVRAQMSKALGGRRGMVEAAVPTILFTVCWLTTRELRLALVVSLVAAAAMLAVRLVQRSTVQFCLNAIFGIGIGWLFVVLSARRGGSADDQALAYFLPGIIYNGAYTIVLALTCIVGWPLVGFMVGSVTGDPTAWHRDRQVVRLCTLLTWLLTIPCLIRVVVQAPLWFAAKAGTIEADSAVAALGILKIAMGWPLQLAALAAMVWVLSRDRTPVVEPAP